MSAVQPSPIRNVIRTPAFLTSALALGIEREEQLAISRLVFYGGQSGKLVRGTMGNALFRIHWKDDINVYYFVNQIQVAYLVAATNDGPQDPPWWKDKLLKLLDRAWIAALVELGRRLIATQSTGFLHRQSLDVDTIDADWQSIHPPPVDAHHSTDAYNYQIAQASRAGNMFSTFEAFLGHQYLLRFFFGKILAKLLFGPSRVKLSSAANLTLRSTTQVFADRSEWIDRERFFRKVLARPSLKTASYAVVLLAHQENEHDSPWKLSLINHAFEPQESFISNQLSPNDHTDYYVYGFQLKQASTALSSTFIARAMDQNEFYPTQRSLHPRSIHFSIASNKGATVLMAL